MSDQYSKTIASHIRVNATLCRESVPETGIDSALGKALYLIASDLEVLAWICEHRNDVFMQAYNNYRKETTPKGV